MAHTADPLMMSSVKTSSAATGRGVDVRFVKVSIVPTVVEVATELSAVKTLVPFCLILNVRTVPVSTVFTMTLHLRTEPDRGATSRPGGVTAVPVVAAASMKPITI